MTNPCVCLALQIVSRAPCTTVHGNASFGSGCNVTSVDLAIGTERSPAPGHSVAPAVSISAQKLSDTPPAKVPLGACASVE